jgi:hypothetical protein
MHWHGFAYTGSTRPPDSAARDMNQAVAPNEIGMFFRKPQSMRAGAFTAPDPAWEWLRGELEEAPPLATALPVAALLEGARDSLARGADVYVGYCTARALLPCPREGERGPAPPRSGC